MGTPGVGVPGIGAPGIGLLGGSFDPIHHGHLRMAEEALEQLRLDQVLLIPARPWQRSTQASDAQRLHMVELACQGHARLRPDPIELQAQGPSYTVDTLIALRSRLGAATPLWLILGADAFLGLPSWRAWQRLEQLCNIAVVQRPGHDLAQALPAALQGWWSRRLPGAPDTGRLALLDAPLLEISATAIRSKLAQQRSVRHLLPDRILDYIENEGLYHQEGHGS